LGIQLGGGNPNLKPEESTTWTIGASWAPSSIPGLNLDLTFFNVHYKDIIDTPGAAVFGSISASAEEIYQAYITRRPSTVTQGADDTAFNALVAYYLAQPSFTGQALSPVNLIIDARSNNAGVIKTDGLDFRLGYEFGAGNSKFNAGISGSYFFNYDRSLTADAPLISRIDLIDFPQKYRLRGELGWQNERGFSAFAFGNFTPSYQNTYAVPIASVDSYLTVDAMLAYDTGESGARSGLNNVQLSLNAQNLFDTPPPFVAAFSQNFDSAITSMLQRVISLSIAKKF
jgi:iron complex outermembrane receptor protein